jgi:site-specific DNA-methyltransferase (adenine-specific)
LAGTPEATMSCEIVCGDCVEVMGGLAAGCARLVFADPPYNPGVDYGPGSRTDRLPPADYLGWCREWIEAGARLLKPDGSFWILTDSRWAGAVQVMAADVGLHWRETIVWHETFGTYCEGKFGRDHRPLLRLTRHPTRQCFHPDRVPSARQLVYNDRRANPDGRVPGNVWQISRVCGTFKERVPGFPTRLPLGLVWRIVRTASDPGDLVVDPFSGSGTTGVICAEEQRAFVGVELNADYAARSRERIAATEPAGPRSTTGTG